MAKPVFDSGIYSSGLNPNFASALITDSVRAELKNLLTSFAGDNFKLLGINSLPAALSFYDYLSDIGDGIEWNNINFTDFAHDATIQRLFGQVTDYLGLDRNQATWSPRLIYALNHLKADVEDLLGINSSAELYENGNISYGPDYSFRSPVVHTMGFGTFIGVRNFSPYRTPIDDVPGIANSDTLLPNMALNGASGPAEDVISIPGAENTGFRYLAPEMPPIKPGRNAQLADAELQKLLRDFGPVRGDALLEKSRAFKSEFELLLDELVTA
ncbi:hypothetical protein [Victivallis sp. Marseille-Q1083]|uniref:hypothetical protein n=1 Tax=Victivallis sp. Marseille-Q1083 TaxID=2717288 RepID=UPI0020CA6F9E|nr:hypothetical protein [Victivallis sp. Marseille-Q1083]